MAQAAGLTATVYDNRTMGSGERGWGTCQPLSMPQPLHLFLLWEEEDAPVLRVDDSSDI